MKSVHSLPESVFEPGIIFKIFGENSIFWLHSSVFTSEEWLENVSFHSFLPLKERLMASLNKRHAPNSRKNVAEQGIIMPN